MPILGLTPVSVAEGLRWKPRVWIFDSEADVLGSTLKKTFQNGLINLSFPFEKGKGASWKSKMSENYHEMWNVNLPHLPELPKFCKQSRCALNT